MPKCKSKPKISSKTKWAIRTYAKQGYSANTIQKKLKNQGLGIQRKKLLAEVRKLKGTKPKAYPQKYTPKKYRKQPKSTATVSRRPRIRRAPIYFGKHVAVYRYAQTKRHPKAYSARFEFYGNGKDLAKAIRLTLGGIVPRWENPHVECSARAFLDDPYNYGEKGTWVDRPNIES